MLRALKLCFGVSMALVACNRSSPLSTSTPSPADASQSSQDGSPITASDGAPASSDGGTSIGDAATIESGTDTGVVEVRADAPSDLVPADGGRVPYHAIAVATGEYHACALLDDHRVKCWGDNYSGQLGLGDKKQRGSDSSTMGDNLPTVDLGTGRTATAIAASRYSSCAILDDQTVKCWRSGIGLEPGDMGDHLAALDFGGRKAAKVAMGEYSDCASMDDDTIWCWASEGVVTPRLQSGLPMKPVRALGPADSGIVALYEDGTLSRIPCCGSPPPAESPLPVVPSGRTVVSVAGGESNGDRTCVLLDDATTICQDRNLKDRTGPAGAIAIGVMRLGGLCSAFSDGSVRCRQSCRSPYPCSNDGAFLLSSPAVTVTSNGEEFACALLADGEVECWDFYAASTSDHLGAVFDVMQPDGGSITYGPWHPVDLGTRP
jgi:hypothetical protein